MKAWIVKAANPIEGASYVRFADTIGKAKYAALEALREHGEVDEYSEVSARRFPAMDGRESNPPTMKELIDDHGWRTQCPICERPIDADGADRHYFEEDDGPEFEDVVWRHDTAYCKECCP
jgi:hypothetical protein